MRAQPSGQLNRAVSRRIIRVQCAWCGRMKTRGRFEGERLPLIHQFGGRDVSHGICPACARLMSPGITWNAPSLRLAA